MTQSKANSIKLKNVGIEKYGLLTLLSTRVSFHFPFFLLKKQGNKPSSLPYPPQSQIPPSSSSISAVSPTYPPQPQPLLIRPQPPRIYEFTPQQGVEGDLLTITLASDQPGHPLKIGFGSFIAETKQLQQPTYTTLTTRVPSFSLTRCHELGVPLSIITWSGDNEVTDSWLVGYFIYNNLGKYFSIL